MLSAEEIVNHRSKHLLNLPIIGIKQIEPDGSRGETASIENSLSAVKELISFERVRIIGSLSQAIWDPHLNSVVVTKQTGSHWSAVGHMVHKKLHLYPEEALYLLEIGALEIYYDEVPLSIQRAYAVLLEPKTDVSLQQYRVYSHLNAHGYKVLRHSMKNCVTKYEKQVKVHKLGIKHKDRKEVTSKRKKLHFADEQSERRNRDDPINTNELHMDFEQEFIRSQILQKLQIVNNDWNSYDFDSDPNSELDIKYDIFLTSSGKSSFKKSILQLPKFRLCIFRSDEEMPDFRSIYHVSKKYQDDVPIIYAVVFPDFVSFYEINSINLPLCS